MGLTAHHGGQLGDVVTAEAAAVEVVRTLCGSVGLIAAVPLTTLLAAALAPQGTRPSMAVPPASIARLSAATGA